MKLSRLFWLALVSPLTAPVSANPLALVYDGPGSCAEDCSLAAAEVARQAGFEVRMVKPIELNATSLSRAALYVQPGGHADEVARALREAQKEALRRFIKRGGRYLGFCAGAFFTDKLSQDRPERGLGILPGDALVYETPVPPNPGPGQALPLTWNGRLRYVYFEGGAWFRLKKLFLGRVIATFETGEPATIIFPYGKGRVAVSGAHPEAPAWWFPEGNDNDSSEPNLDLGLGMVRELFQ